MSGLIAGWLFSAGIHGNFNKTYIIEEAEEEMGEKNEKTMTEEKKPSGPLWTVRYTLLNATYFVAF